MPQVPITIALFLPITSVKTPPGRIVNNTASEPMDLTTPISISEAPSICKYCERYGIVSEPEIANKNQDMIIVPTFPLSQKERPTSLPSHRHFINFQGR